MTVRIISGEAARWSGLRNVTLGPGRGAAGTERGSNGEDDGRREPPAEGFRVEGARAYRDRLVLKLRGVDDADGAERLRGRAVWAPADEVPALPADVYYTDRLMGLRVVDERGRRLGSVRDVVETGGVDLLAVEDERGRETLIPLAKEMIREVDETRGEIRVRPVRGIESLNEREERA